MFREYFIQKARQAHGDAYDYSLIPELFNSKDKVSLICRKHSVFFQRAGNHLRGQGCRKCAAESKSKPLPMSWLEVVGKAEKVHSGRYTYPLTSDYRSQKTKIRIVCKKHGEFLQKASAHLGGDGCYLCGKETVAKKATRTLPEILSCCTEVHAGRYTYPPQNETAEGGRINTLTAVCPVHGSFKVPRVSHLKGQGCPICSKESLARLRFEKFINKATSLYAGVYSYALVDYSFFLNKNPKIPVGCKTHGVFELTVRQHTKDFQGCPTCRAESALLQFNQRAAFLHKNAYTYEGFPNQKIASTYMHRIICPQHGEFFQSGNNHLAGYGCPRCGRLISKPEIELRKFLEELLGVGEVEAHVRGSKLPGLGSKEVDILIRSKCLAIEFDGLIWHSSRFCRKFKSSHLEKTLLLESLGYRLIHVFEDEWRDNKEAVKNRLRAIVNRGEVIFARKTTAVEISWLEASSMLKTAHLQGAGAPSKHCFGLYSQKQLVAVATFGPARFGHSGWELLRFASVGRVIGGAGKLIKIFTDARGAAGQSLISFADRRWSNGGVYKALGFNLEGYSSPGYAYVRRSKHAVRRGRHHFQKHKLAQLFGDNFNPELTEVENCKNNGWFQIYDCGTSRWRKTL